eukprot:m.50523 g.50523  ORF g.50523 m.50523 type:complete len:453 (+) comp10888_c0_seq5:22-1380(+)
MSEKKLREVRVVVEIDSSDFNEDVVDGGKSSTDVPVHTSSSFHRTFVEKRRPCKIVGKISSRGANFHNWTLDYLNDKCGDKLITIEHRSGEGANFGQGHRLRVKMKEFIDRMKQGDTRFYMSTQPREVTNDEGTPVALDPVLTALKEDFPLVPPFLSSLNISTCNLWIGASKAGSSSGLHHDYHDNLYVVLKGKKRFRLFPPSLARSMYTYGTIEDISLNGRIIYKSPTLKERLESCRQAEEAAIRKVDEAKKGGNTQDILSAEAHLDRIMESMLEMAEEIEEEEDLEGEGGLFDSVCDEEYNEDTDKPQKEFAKDEDVQQDPNSNDADNDETLDCDLSPIVKSLQDIDEALATFPAIDTPPNSFSKVSLPFDETMFDTFPDFPAHEQITCTLSAGEMLYLPNGWFHEVTSMAAEEDSSDSSDAPNVHIAFNYWFYPPNNDDINPTKKSKSK